VKRLQVCADDYALNPGVDAGIEALATQGRLSHVSCMSSRPRWAAVARRLTALPIQPGLHFNLTEGAPLNPELRRAWPRFPGLGKLLLTAGVRALPRALIAAEWQAQLEAYRQALGAEPKFLDGHQHVHALPGVRETLLEAAAALGIPMRSTARLLGPGFAFKRQVIAACGGRRLLSMMKAHGVPHADALVGVYDFAPEADYRALMRGWLAGLHEGETALLFCHPALGRDADDAIAVAREREAAYLGSAAFTEDLTEFGVTFG
jgi:predicted glycoside hydrolase/deacetylase ChbG (UPF0249 family)